MSEHITDPIARKRPWIFLILWILAQVITASTLFKWSLSNPDVTDWVWSLQGYFITGMFGLLMGVAIITVMQRPKIPDGSLDVFSPRLSYKKIRLGWFLVGIAVAALSYVHPKTWQAGGSLARAILTGRNDGGLAYVLGAGVLGPIPEELILRGYLYQGFRAS
jgi:membrane protease YdiL (CAAX protease family)